MRMTVDVGQAPLMTHHLGHEARMDPYLCGLMIALHHERWNADEPNSGRLLPYYLAEFLTLTSSGEETM
jgi:hypothetical protein